MFAGIDFVTFIRSIFNYKNTQKSEFDVGKQTDKFFVKIYVTVR